VTTINCKVEEKGVRCSTTIEVTEEIAKNFNGFICKNHPDTVQRRVAGNTKLKRPDVHFQEVQFDKDLKRSAKPVSTSHIRNQGSEILSDAEIRQRLRDAGITVAGDPKPELGKS
jgi:hypothetical protein